MVSERTRLEDKFKSNRAPKVQTISRFPPMAHIRGRIWPRDPPRTRLNDSHTFVRRKK